MPESQNAISPAEPSPSAPFRDNQEMLRAYLEAVKLRRRALEIDERTFEDAEKWKASSREASREFWARFHAEPVLPFAKKLLGFGLSNRQIDLVLALGASVLSLVRPITDLEDLRETMGLTEAETIDLYRDLSSDSALLRHGLVHCRMPEDRFSRVAVWCVSWIPSEMLPGLAFLEGGLAFRDEDALLKGIRDLAGMYSCLLPGILRRAMRGGVEDPFWDSPKERLAAWIRLFERIEFSLDTDLQASPVATVRREAALDRRSFLVLLLLMGEAVGSLDPEDDALTGEGLATSVSVLEGEPARLFLGLLGRGGALARARLMRPVRGGGGFCPDDPEEIARSSFGLTPKARHSLLGRRKFLRSGLVREEARLSYPKLRLNDVILPPRLREKVEEALVQVRNRNLILRTWRLGRRLDYGLGVTMLFAGPPGTGKTLTARAIAGELKRPLLEADYSRIQSCWVGETEKNVVSLFRQARRNGAVLFWDEADAMFFDRDAASRTWEVREVNVLLQEIERFEGVCILATNRRPALDRALERRISLKLHFERPGVAERILLWKELMPPELPREEGIDFARIAREFDLSGGEIRNAILLAARAAAARGRPQRLVKESDLVEAIREARSESGSFAVGGFRT